MGFEILVSQFQDTTKRVFERIAINQIVCFSSRVEQEKLSKKDVDNYLRLNSYNKIEVNQVLCFHAVDKFKKPTQEIERNELIDEVKNYLAYLNNEIKTLCSQGEYKYELNELFKEILKDVGELIQHMNFLNWRSDIHPLDPNGGFFLIVENKRYPYPKISLDIETRREATVDLEFNFRRSLLTEIQVAFAALFSEYLFLPVFESIPTITLLDARPTDICELIIALTESKYFENSQQLKSILLAMFNIESVDYNKAIHEIKNRKKGRNQFVRKFSEGFC